LAYKRIIDEPAKYGFKLPTVANHPYFVSVPVTQDIDVDKVIQLSEITREQFLALNPSYYGPVILSGFNQEILLPYGKSELFKQNLSTNKAPLTSWTVVRLDRTDTVDNLASRLNTDADQIREVNKIPKGMKIRSGSTVIIPRHEDHKDNVPIELAQNLNLSLEREFVPVPVVMKCRGKRCVAVPSNLANYNSKDPSNAKVVNALNQSKSSSSKDVRSKSSSKSSKSSAPKSGASSQAQKKSSTTKKSNSK
jgi:membrane-bound lytic murein transglycosylase D